MLSSYLMQNWVQLFPELHYSTKIQFKLVVSLSSVKCIYNMRVYTSSRTGGGSLCTWGSNENGCLGLGSVWLFLSCMLSSRSHLFSQYRVVQLFSYNVNGCSLFSLSVAQIWSDLQKVSRALYSSFLYLRFALLSFIMFCTNICLTA